MRLAERLGLSIASATMGIADGQKYLLVERYDRKIVGPKRVLRSHQEDFCQALGFYPTAKYEARRGPGIKQLFTLIDKQARRSAVDRLRLLDLVV
jgi:serine/threonine-protein kinase HipA